MGEYSSAIQSYRSFLLAIPAAIFLAGVLVGYALRSLTH